MILMINDEYQQLTSVLIVVVVENLAYEQGVDFSMTLSGPNAMRPLPEPPGWPYSSMQRDPSSVIHTPNGTMATSLGLYTCL